MDNLNLANNSNLPSGNAYLDVSSNNSLPQDIFQLKQQEPHTYPLREVLRGMRAS